MRRTNRFLLPVRRTNIIFTTCATYKSNFPIKVHTFVRMMRKVSLYINFFGHLSPPAVTWHNGIPSDYMQGFESLQWGESMTAYSRVPTVAILDSTGANPLVQG